MNFSFLSDQELHAQTLCASATEKSATLTLLEYLSEVDRRQLYAARGFSSLWMYVHKELGYSEAQTSERVGAVKLMAKVPEVKKCLEENRLTMTSAAKFASFVRREKISSEKTLELLDRVVEKSSREVEQILFAEQGVPEARPDSIKAVGTKLSRIAFDADEEFMELLAKVKTLQNSSAVPLQDMMKKTMKEYVAKRQLKAPSQHAASRVPEAKNTASRYIPAPMKTSVRTRSQDQCEFVARITDPTTGKTAERRCNSRSQLHFDHIEPFALGGPTTKENIRHLCKKHNFYVASKRFGMAKMLQFSQDKRK